MVFDQQLVDQRTSHCCISLCRRTRQKAGTTEGFLLVDMASLHFRSLKVQYNKLHLVQSTLHSKCGLYNKVLVTKLLCTNTLYHHDVVPPLRLRQIVQSIVQSHFVLSHLISLLRTMVLYRTGYVPVLTATRGRTSSQALF